MPTNLPSPEASRGPTNVRQHFDRSQERADQLIRIAKGDTTLAEVRQKANERKIKHRAKQSVFRNTDDADDGGMRLGKQQTELSA